MAESKTEHVARIRAEVAKMKDETKRERFRRIAEITRRWREGFSALKEENDRMQRELKDWYELEMDQIQNYYRENIEAGVPYRPVGR